MSEESIPAVSASADPPAPPPDSSNPAFIDAKKTFVITMVGSVLFVGAVVLFIL